MRTVSYSRSWRISLLLAAAGVVAAHPVLAGPCVGEVDINGSGTATFFQPFATASNDARTTSIYLASEFGCDGGPISAMEYYLSTIPGQAMNNLTIRLRHTTASSYSVGAFDNTGWTIVYQASTTITTTGWHVFNFSAAFNWDGVRNLEVDVSFNNSTHSTSGLAYYFVGAALRTMYLSCNDCDCGGSTDPLLWTTCGGISRTSWTPRVRFVFPPWNDDCSAVTPVTLTPDVPVTFTGNNLGATGDCALIAGLSQVWHAITLPQYMDITLDYCTTTGPFGNAWGLFVRGCPCTEVVWADGYDTTTCGDGNLTFRWAGLPAGTYYYPVLLDPPAGSAGPYVLHVVGALGPGGYCSAGSIVPNCDEYIGRVQVGTIDNSTDCSQPGGYGDYTALSSALAVGTGYPITVTNGHSHSGDQCKVWVDWNQDLDFDDVAEDFTMAGSPGEGPYTGAITPPAGAMLGNTRIRVRITSSEPSPCGKTPSGEVEDYTITVLPPPGDSCVNPMPIVLEGSDLPYSTAHTTCGHGDEYTQTCLGDYDGGEDLLYELALTEPMCLKISVDGDLSQVGVAVDSTCPPDNSCLAYALSYAGDPVIRKLNLAAGVYYIMIDSKPPTMCTDFTLTIEACPPPPPNDDCADATPIGDVTDLGFDTTYATHDGDGTCLYTASPNIWYCYTATCSGEATVSLCGSSFTTRLAVYDGCACSPLPPLLGCTQYGCSGSLRSELKVPVLAGQQYLIEIGSNYTSSGTGVLTVSCNQVQGACCLPGTCVVDYEANCLAQGGTYAGNDTACQPQDCNDNGIDDTCDVAAGTSADCDGNRVPDECDPDCNQNGTPDPCEFGRLYQHDDGTYEYPIGLAGSYVAWLNHFTVVGTAGRITRVDVVFGMISDGRPFTVYLWSDPNQDGDPNDAGVLASADCITESPGWGVLYSVDIPDTDVGPSGTHFFAGVIMQNGPGEGPLAIDLTDSRQQSWLAADPNSPLDPNDLTAPMFPLGRVDDYGTPGNWLIRVAGAATAGDCNQNGIPDECEAELTWYPDADGDQYGDPNAPTLVQCDPPAGYVHDHTDCDDTDPEIHPGATEVCDGQDNDCDGQSDEGAIGSRWYRDADGDGYGDANDATQACAVPAGYVSNHADCDDGDPDVHPGAAEACDGQDNDCDGQADEGALATWYRDADGDGAGDLNDTTQACAAPVGYVSDHTDCDDADLAVHPGATEVCDGQDNDCDGRTDEGLSLTTWYRDADEDGYGNPDRTTRACSRPAGYVSNHSDCEDTDADIHPGATEVCDGKDNDCDARTDEGLALSTWYRDADGDGYGDPDHATRACGQPADDVSDDSDCDDTDAGVHPGVTEQCDGQDNDCDGRTDENCPPTPAENPSTWYADADGDGYGDAASSREAIDQPAGYVSDNTDCDDADPDVYPAAAEICDSKDNDCDGDVDEDCTPADEPSELTELEAPRPPGCGACGAPAPAMVPLMTLALLSLKFDWPRRPRG